MLGIVAIMVVLTVMLSTTLGEASTQNQLAREYPWTLWTTMSVLYYSFLLAGVNTSIAGNGFSARRNQLLAYLKSHTEWLLDNEGQQHSPPLPARKQILGLHRMGAIAGREPAFVVHARGPYQPEPYCNETESYPVAFDYGHYVELINEEVHAARLSAGRIAAALGGLFVAALQVYGKLT